MDDSISSEYRSVCMINLRAGPSEPEYTGPWNVEQMRNEQASDPGIGKFYSIMQNNEQPPTPDELIREDRITKAYCQQWDSMKLINGVLYRRFESPDGLRERLQLVVPASAREELIKGCHTGHTGGHLGVRRTRAQVILRGYWVGWNTDVARIVANAARM